ncbi:37S ribosomal protein S9, mitochondrial [Pleurotus pulmonarius]|nr:37S ribosomal protein S9, mitochondrial [Pleurotus pulmonarius]
MNLTRTLRGPVQGALRARFYTSTTRQFIPPAQLDDIQPPFKRPARPSQQLDSAEEEDPRTRSLNAPSSPSFYTARPAYYDQVEQIETAIKHARQALKTLQLLPLPEFARASLPPLQPVWKDKDEMSTVFENKMTTSRYRKVLTLLNQLNDYHRIAKTAGCEQLAEGISHVVEFFERGNKDAVLARGKRKAVSLDQHGRSYTFGKRKTSAARVWMIPVQPGAQGIMPAIPKSASEAESVEELLGLKSAEKTSSPKSEPPASVNVTPSTILVNNIPLGEYFHLPADRERVVRPFKVAGVLGAYNVFVLARGGGTTGQSGAIAHGIAKGLVVHEPNLDAVLRRCTPRIQLGFLMILTIWIAKLLRRDPRMVERKKTGMAKARKRVSHSTDSAKSQLTSSRSIPGLNVSGTECCGLALSVYHFALIQVLDLSCPILPLLVSIGSIEAAGD